MFPGPLFILPLLILVCVNSRIISQNRVMFTYQKPLDLTHDDHIPAAACSP